MPTYLLTWKPSRAPWPEIVDSIRELQNEGSCHLTWSCGRSKRIEKGDRVFLLRQGADRPGIVASGNVSRAPYLDKHWDITRHGEESLYIDVRAYALLDADKMGILPRKDLDFGSVNLWNTQSSGVAVPSLVADELERRWSAHLTQLGQEPVLLPDEVWNPDCYIEGATRRVSVCIYERNPHARQRCIEYYGACCSVCGFDFEAAYGKHGSGYIHVHHLKPLAEIGAKYEINPVADLRPICPNCHAMIHRGQKTLTIESLQKLLFRSHARFGQVHKGLI